MTALNCFFICLASLPYSHTGSLDPSTAYQSHLILGSLYYSLKSAEEVIFQTTWFYYFRFYHLTTINLRKWSHLKFLFLCPGENNWPLPLINWLPSLFELTTSSQHASYLQLPRSYNSLYIRKASKKFSCRGKNDTGFASFSALWKVSLTYDHKEHKQ